MTDDTDDAGTKWGIREREERTLREAFVKALQEQPDNGRPFFAWAYMLGGTKLSMSESADQIQRRTEKDDAMFRALGGKALPGEKPEETINRLAAGPLPLIPQFKPRAGVPGL